MAIVNAIEVSDRFQPNCASSSGATKTLHAYSEPSARFIERPPAIRHHRSIVGGAEIEALAMSGLHVVSAGTIPRGRESDTTPGAAEAPRGLDPRSAGVREVSTSGNRCFAIVETRY